MKFSAWVKKQADAQGAFKTNVMRDLAEKCGISLLTLQFVERGGKMKHYDKAKTVSDATDGKVTIKDLCETE